MKIPYCTCILKNGAIANSSKWLDTFTVIKTTIAKMEHGEKPGKFTIYGQSGKKRDEGNGVTPIKEIFMKMLSNEFKPAEFKREVPLSLNSVQKPGNIDVVLKKEEYTFAIEWETGNISSSHRAMNKLLLGLTKGVIHAGILIVPTKNFAKFLTDRVGNYEELNPYFCLWKNYSIDNGLLYILGIEHDGISKNRSYRFPKRSDGRALG